MNDNVCKVIWNGLIKRINFLKYLNDKEINSIRSLKSARKEMPTQWNLLKKYHKFV